MAPPFKGLELRSLVTNDAELVLSLEEVPVPEVAADEVLVRMMASPVNPSDIGLLLGPAAVDTARTRGAPGRPVLVATIPAASMGAMSGRLGASMAVGNEGAGTVVGAGPSPAAQALLGRTVAILGGGMYTRYRKMKASDCLLLPHDATAADGASCFVNPLTALGMVETMRAEGHKALVHTAAASNLGQMLHRICAADGINLVNIVRSNQQVGLLRAAGAAHVCDASTASFERDLIDTLVATGATIGFDATGGGTLASRILNGMEAAANRSAQTYSRYGSTVQKQVYLYGNLDTGPTELARGFGMAWSVGGWLLAYFLQKAGAERVQQLKARVARELKTTFASRYAGTLSLAQVLKPEILAMVANRATGTKYLVDPSIP